ncbi:MAG: hypothetical protein QG568_112 [Patescibacteria group bacterium]|nr:hypothetical protein [Patescibacteria group bacterium]
MSESAPSLDPVGQEPESTNLERNPFKLVEYEGMLVPQVLLDSGRGEDLEQYTQGWTKQKAHIHDQIASGQSSTWYEAGASRCWSNSDRPVKGSGNSRGEKPLDELVNSMRKNPGTIPRDAWQTEE